jgi:hypothetical protein
MHSSFDCATKRLSLVRPSKVRPVHPRKLGAPRGEAQAAGILHVELGLILPAQNGAVYRVQRESLGRIGGDMARIRVVRQRAVGRAV